MFDIGQRVRVVQLHGDGDIEFLYYLQVGDVGTVEQYDFVGEQYRVQLDKVERALWFQEDELTLEEN